MAVYRLEGECLRCGACCRGPVIHGQPCPHFADPDCLVHDHKPEPCRDWPKAGVGIFTTLEPGCGYRIVEVD